MGQVRGHAFMGVSENKDALFGDPCKLTPFCLGHKRGTPILGNALIVSSHISALCSCVMGPRLQAKGKEATFCVSAAWLNCDKGSENNREGQRGDHLPANSLPGELPAQHEERAGPSPPSLCKNEASCHRAQRAFQHRG